MEHSPGLPQDTKSLKSCSGKRDKLDASQWIDGCRSKLVNVVSGVPQGSVLGPLLFLLYTSELFSILENKLIGYADDSTLITVVPSPDVRVSVAESLNRDLVRVNAWCDLWGMK